MSRADKFTSGLALLPVAIVVAGLTAAPREAHALMPIVGGPVASATAYATCIAAGGAIALCQGIAIVADPPSVDVNGLTMSLQYDPAIYTFNPAGSGPLDVFSVGGGAASPSPGVGTQPLTLLPSSGLNPGAALPGSTLSYIVSPGLVTLNYQLASPVTVSSDVNFFLFDFTLAHPVKIDLATSSVTYSATGAGADFTQTAFACTTPTGPGQCGSASPATGVSINYAVVPEPAPWAMMLVGFGGLGAVFRGSRHPAFRKRLGVCGMAPPVRSRWPLRGFRRAFIATFLA